MEEQKHLIEALATEEAQIHQDSGSSDGNETGPASDSRVWGPKRLLVSVVALCAAAYAAGSYVSGGNLVNHSKAVDGVYQGDQTNSMVQLSACDGPECPGQSPGGDDCDGPNCHGTPPPRSSGTTGTFTIDKSTKADDCEGPTANCHSNKQKVDFPAPAPATRGGRPGR